MQPVLAWLSDASGDNAALQLAVKVAVAIISVLVPATAMGGTLPVLAQFVASRAESLGVRAGGLYAVNTLGACAGALAVPAVLLPSLGATGALRAAITINLLVAAGALLLDRSEGLRPSDSPTRSLARRSAGALPPPREALRRDLAEALAQAGRSRGSLAVLARWTRRLLASRRARGRQGVSGRAGSLVKRWSLPRPRARSRWRSKRSRRAHSRWYTRIPVYSFATVVAVLLAGLAVRGCPCALGASARDGLPRDSPRPVGPARVSGWCCYPRCSCA